MMLRAAICALALLGIPLAARAGHDVLEVDLASEPASLDTQVQWDPASYSV
jgi:hypothetical protein